MINGVKLGLAWDMCQIFSIWHISHMGALNKTKQNKKIFDKTLSSQTPYASLALQKHTNPLHFLLKQKHGNPSLHSISYTLSTKTQPTHQAFCYCISSQNQTIPALCTYCSIIQSGHWARGSNYPARSGTRRDHSSQGTWLWPVCPAWLQAWGMHDLPSSAFEWLSWSEWWYA